MGIRIYCPFFPWDLIQKLIVNENTFFEIEILERLDVYIPPDAVILDIGANIGNHSLYWAGICKANKIYAFEPLPQIYSILQRNIEINDFNNIITPYNIGLGNTHSVGRINTVVKNNIGGTSIIESERYGGLQIERLDDINLPLEKLDFIKIDVEGFEIKTLEGAVQTIQRFHPPVFVESFPDNIAHVKEFFAALGYNPAIPYPCHNYLFLYPK